MIDRLPTQTARYFEKDLKERVNQLLRNNSYRQKQFSTSFYRAVFFFAVWILLLTAALFQGHTPAWKVLLYILAGVFTVPLVLNAGHEGVHKTLGKNKRANQLGCFVFYLLGSSPYLWRLRHIYSHHSLANVLGKDMDIDQSDLVRLSAKQPFYWFHQYQVYYMPFLYCFYTIIWFFFRDIKDLYTHDFGKKVNVKHKLIEILKLISAKFFVLAIFLFLPFLFEQQKLLPSLFYFLLYNIAASVTTTFALVSTHVGTQQYFFEEQELACSSLSYERHQLAVTSDFATNNKLLTWFFGGFNHHVAHHLFPAISYTHYPAITKIIESVCTQYNIQYYSHSSLKNSIKEHFKSLKALSKK